MIPTVLMGTTGYRPVTINASRPPAQNIGVYIQPAVGRCAGTVYKVQHRKEILKIFNNLTVILYILTQIIWQAQGVLLTMLQYLVWEKVILLKFWKYLLWKIFNNFSQLQYILAKIISQDQGLLLTMLRYLVWKNRVCIILGNIYYEYYSITSL